MSMPLQNTSKDAFDALKRKDFVTARRLMADQDAAAFAVPHFLVLGLAELALEEWKDAKETFTTATERFSDYALFWLNRGLAEENLDLINEAVESQEMCIRLDPQQGEAHGNLANLYRKQKRFALSEKMARRALELGTSKGEALNSLGLAMSRQGKHEQAENAFKQAMREAPTNPFIIANRANLAVDRLNIDEALPLFAQARSLEDRALFRRDEGMARMLGGDYEKGWELYEERLLLPHALRLRPACPQWRGEALLSKKLLIIAEQGLGDVIQFCRYQDVIPGNDLVWAVPPALVRLLSGRLRGTVVSETEPLPACDYWVPIMSLPYMTHQGAPQASGPYLRPTMTPYLPEGKKARKIGLVWAGSPTHERDYERSLPLTMLEEALSGIEADLYAPFIGSSLDEKSNLPIQRLDSLITDFADTAALISQMHCLITVDTAVAHLAGALGIKTYVLLPFCCDWRWGTRSETTPWYPSLTLLRQPRYSDWPSVMELLKSRL